MLFLFASEIISTDKSLVSSRYDPYTKVGLDKASTVQEAYDAFKKYKESLGPGSHENDDRYKAYRILTDSRLRRAYDLFGLEAFAEVEGNQEKANISGVAALYAKNEPIRTYAYLTIEDFFKGVKLSYQFFRKEICKCKDRTGWHCDTCNGHPTITRPFNVEIDVVAGTLPDQVYLFKGACDTSPTAAGGDLEIQLKELPDPVYRRSLYNLIYKLNIGKEDARGNWEKVITLPLQNRVVVNGRKLKPVTIPGKGFPIPGTTEKGFLIIQPVVNPSHEDL